MARGIARDHDKKRAALRQGAARYFAKHGYDRASMTGAARECGVSKALIYHYYDSKEALLFDILQSHLTDLVIATHEASGQGLRELVHAILTTYADADSEHKLQLDALSTLPDDLQQPLIDLQRQLVSLMSAALARENPGLSGERLRAITMSVFGILNWFYMWNRPGKGLSRSAYADLATDFIRGGLTAV